MARTFMTTEQPRLIDIATSRQREVTIVAAILADCGQSKLGPNISSALAYCPEYWEDAVARKLACAIKCCIKAGRPISDPSLAEYLAIPDREWLFNPSFNGQRSTTLAIAEHEAFDLLIRYRGKYMTRVVGRAYDQMMKKPELAYDIARQMAENIMEEF